MTIGEEIRRLNSALGHEALIPLSNIFDLIFKVVWKVVYTKETNGYK